MECKKFNITSSFLCEEERSGFTVTTERKKIWAVELDLLKRLLDVCSKYDIKVSVFAGTLLGAVRHRGFIPWDDDVDVCLLQEDFDKLQVVAEKEFRHPYFFQTALTDSKYFCGYARLRNSDTTGIIVGTENIEYNNGIYIDVFVLNGKTDSAFKMKYQLALCHLIKIVWALMGDYNHRKGLKRLISPMAGFFLRNIFSYDTLFYWYRRIITKYDSDSDIVTLLTHDMYFIERYWCRKSVFDNLMLLPFENIEVPVPCAYDELLRNSYGDYEKFPPVEKRGRWHEGIIEFNPDLDYVTYIKTKLQR